MDRIHVTVPSQEEADRLRADFAELMARVNGDLIMRRLYRNDPLSVEAAVLHAEQSIEYHLRAFPDNHSLQNMATEIKERFGESIRSQARRLTTKK